MHFIPCELAIEHRKKLVHCSSILERGRERERERERETLLAPVSMWGENVAADRVVWTCVPGRC